MPARREYLSQVPLRVPPIVRERAQRALELGLIEPGRYLQATLSVEPAIDIMRDEDLRLRIATIGVLAEQGTAEAVRLLELLASDPDDYVRTHAAQALERIDTRWYLFVKQREAAATSSASPEAWADVARAHMTLAQMKARAPVLRDFHLQQAANALERALEHEERATWLLMKAEIELQADQDGEAESLVERALAQDPQNLEAQLLLAKLFYRRGDYARVQRQCRVLATREDLSPDLGDVVAFWTVLSAESRA